MAPFTLAGLERRPPRFTRYRGGETFLDLACLYPFAAYAGRFDPDLSARFAYRHLGTHSSGERPEAKLARLLRDGPGCPAGGAFSDLARMTQPGKGASEAALMWRICGYKVRGSGAGVEPTEPWVARPHWF